MLGSPHVGKKNTSAAPSPAPLGARQPSTSIEHTAFLVHAAQLAVLKNEKSSKTSMLKRQELEHEHLSICGRSFAQRSVRAAQRAAQGGPLAHPGGSAGRSGPRDSASRIGGQEAIQPGILFWRRCRNELLAKLQKRAFSGYKHRRWIIMRAERAWCYTRTRAERASWTHARSVLAGHTRGAC